jgi:probable lipoprotein NlpC
MTKKLMILLSVLFTLFTTVSPAQRMTIQGSPDDSIYRVRMNYFIRDWWDSPYKWGGTSKAGIDCSAFAQKLFKNVYQVDLPRTSRMQYKACVKIKKEDLETGDLMFFRSSRGMWHVGTYIYKGFFVHSSSHEGVHINSISDPYYQKHVFAYGRILKTEDIY